MINLWAARCPRWGVAAGGPEAQRKLWGRPGPPRALRIGSRGTSTVENFEKWQNIGPSSQFSDAEFWRHPNWNDAPKLTCCFFLHLGWNHPYFAVAWQTQLLGRYMKVCNRQQTTRVYQSPRGLTLVYYIQIRQLRTSMAVFHVHLWRLVPLGWSRLCEILHPPFNAWDLKGYSMWVVNF